jgi:thiol:disulfide interchange protein DsbC
MVRASLRVNLVLALLLLAPPLALAQQADPVISDAALNTLRDKLTVSLDIATQNQLKITSINATPMATIVEVQLDSGEVLYSDVSGDFVFAGDMFRASPQGLQNLSQQKRQAVLKERIAAIPEREMIVFSPAVTRASITVFTDVDCTYCRTLHRDMEKLLALGIEVRYVAYPRGGENANSYTKMISVWCSRDRQEALTYAKNGDDMPQIDCDNPVLEHYALGNQIGIAGTPAIILPDGTLVPGYVESSRLAALLNLSE